MCHNVFLKILLNPHEGPYKSNNFNNAPIDNAIVFTSLLLCAIKLGQPMTIELGCIITWDRRSSNEKKSMSKNCL